MSNRISIITPVYAPVAQYLHETYESLAKQEMPSGWEWEWIVQEDGETGEVAALLPDDPRIKAGQARRGGAAVARMLALTHAQGSLIRSLDADDVLTPGALAREIDVLERNPKIGWTTCRILDLLPDGSTVGFEHDPPEGRVPRGSVLEHWVSHDYRAQVHPTTLCVRRKLLMFVGGWMALPASSDTSLLMALDAVSDGYFIAEAGLLYRKWPGQVTAQPAHNDPVERSTRMKIIEDRARALTAQGWTWHGEGESAHP